MRRSLTEASRTTLLPGIRHDAPDGLVRALDALWSLLERPNDKGAQMAIRLLHRQGGLSCPSGCGVAVDVDGHAQTINAEVVREEWSCSGCGDRYLIAESRVC
jgi:hypothetical protein